MDVIARMKDFISLGLSAGVVIGAHGPLRCSLARMTPLSTTVRKQRIRSRSMSGQGIIMSFRYRGDKNTQFLKTPPL
jgi:hypothetical protein